MSDFRGYKEMSRILEKLGPLASWLKQNNPNASAISLHKKDRDLIMRWPKAAAALRIRVDQEKNTAEYEGFQLREAKGRGRYEDREPAHG